MSKIAYFGPQGTFTEQAALSVASPTDELFPMPTVAATFDAVRTGVAHQACVPVENSVEGAVPATMDALATGAPLVTMAEVVLPIRFCLLVRPGTRTIGSVASHPHALAQVDQWLSTELPNATPIAASSTAGAAVDVVEGTVDAAITAQVAAKHYPLEVFADDLADVRDARTRFLVLATPSQLPEPTGHDRTSVLAITDDRPGSLADLLVELATRGVNLTRLEARPTRLKLGEYRFYLDFDGHVAEQRIAEALTALHRRCSTVRFLGSYPKADGVGAPPAAGTTEGDFTAARDWVRAVIEGKSA